MLESLGIEGKQIESGENSKLAPKGTISTSSPVSVPGTTKAPTQKEEPRPSLRSFQTRLQKLDRDIQQAEAQLKLNQARADAERRAPVIITSRSGGTRSSAAQDKMRWQILQLEGKLTQLRQERSDVFQAGRRAGYLPGELEGRNIIR